MTINPVSDVSACRSRPTWAGLNLYPSTRDSFLIMVTVADSTIYEPSTCSVVMVMCSCLTYLITSPMDGFSTHASTFCRFDFSSSGITVDQEAGASFSISAKHEERL